MNLFQSIIILTINLTLFMLVVKFIVFLNFLEAEEIK